MEERREPVFSYRPIGIIMSPFQDPAGMPIQPQGARGVQGSVEIYEEYRPGLSDLEGFSRIILIYPFHRSAGYSLVVTPFLDTRPRGVFSTRAPRRPNAIGLSIVRLEEVKDGDTCHRGRRYPGRDPAPRYQALCPGLRRVPWREVRVAHRVRREGRGSPFGPRDSWIKPTTPDAILELPEIVRFLPFILGLP